MIRSSREQSSNRPDMHSQTTLERRDLRGGSEYIKRASMENNNKDSNGPIPTLSYTVSLTSPVYGTDTQSQGRALSIDNLSTSSYLKKKRPTKRGHRDDADESKGTCPCFHTPTGKIRKRQEREARVSSAKQRWFNFSSDTTFHGLKQTVSPERSKYLRAFYILVVLCALVGVVFNVIQLIIRSLEFNTVTRTDIAIKNIMEFPTVTICNISPFRFKGGNSSSDPLYRLSAYGTPFWSLVEPLNISDPEIQVFLNRTPRDIFQDYAMDVDIKATSFDGTQLNSQTDFEVLETPSGRCKQFNGPRWVNKHGARSSTQTGRQTGLHIYLNIRQEEYGMVESAGVRVFITHHDELPRILMDGLDVPPGVSARMAMVVNEYEFLPPPYKSFGDKGCVDVKSAGSSLLSKLVNSSLGYGYQYQDCLDQCVEHYVSKKCLCHGPTLYVEGVRPCTAFEYIYGCYSLTRVQINRQAPDLCDCPRSCTFTKYSVQLSSSQLPSRAALKPIMNFFNVTDPAVIVESMLELRIYYASRLVTKETHVAQYAQGSFLSELGGQTGLFLGASLISAVELIEFLVLVLKGWFLKIFTPKPVAAQ